MDGATFGKINDVILVECLIGPGFFYAGITEQDNLSPDADDWESEKWVSARLEGNTMIQAILIREQRELAGFAE